MTSSSSSFDSKNIFFNPQSIAVIGASEKPGVGKAIFSNIINGYKGKIYPITPSNPTVFGINAFKSVLDISEDIDLSLIHISEPTRLGMISYAVFCLKKKK